MQRTQYVEVFRTRQRHELERVLSELRAARIQAWKQEHSMAGPVTECSPFPVVAAAALYTVSVPRTEMLKATAILSMPIDEASAKRRAGPPDDDDSPDAALDTWAGVVPIATSFGEPVASPGLRPGIPLSASLRRLLSR